MLFQALHDTDLGEVDGTELDRGAMNGSVAEDVDKVLTVFSVQRLSGDAEDVLFMLSCNRNGYVCVGEERAIGILDCDEDLAYVSSAVGNDGGGNSSDVSAPCATEFRIPDDLNGLAYASFPNSGSSKYART